MTHDEMIAVIANYKNGGKVETRPRHGAGGWSPVSIPVWDFNRYEYRIRKEPIVLWGIIWSDGMMGSSFFKEREEAEDYAKGMYFNRVFKMVEVEE